MRLVAQLDNVPMAIAIEYDRHDGDRHVYRWIVTVEDREWTATDLRSGSADLFHAPPLAEMLATLLGFMGAAADSLEYGRRTGTVGENADLFPAELGELLVNLSEELTMARWELEGEAQ